MQTIKRARLAVMGFARQADWYFLKAAMYEAMRAGLNWKVEIYTAEMNRRRDLSTVPVAVFDLREGMTVDELHLLVRRVPDRIAHSTKGGHSFETWTFVKEGIQVSFEDGAVSGWHS